MRGVKALQRLAIPDGRLLDFQDAKMRVEKLTKEVRGHERLEAMRRWVEVSLLIAMPTSEASSPSGLRRCGGGHFLLIPIGPGQYDCIQ